MIDRIARYIGRHFYAHGKQTVVPADVREWVRRAEEIGLQEAPSEQVKKEFRDWITKLVGTEDSSISPHSIGRIFTDGLLASIAYAGDSSKATALIPKYLWDALENEHLPIDQAYRPGQGTSAVRSRISARAHRMLGFAVSIQDAGPDDSDDMVCLLQLANDSAIDLIFGDCGVGSFWIKVEDLKACRFDRVIGVMEGH